MKKIVLILGLLFSTQLAFTQAPEKINYQAVARDASGNPLVNQTLNVTYQIRQSSPTGTSVYTETHTGISTNQFGLFTAEIGGGTPSVGTFAGINWGAGLYYLYVEVNGDPMGSSQLLSVPYALYAKQSANGPQGLPGRNSISIVTPEPAGANCQNGGNKIDVGTDDNGDNILQALEIDFTYFVCNGDSGATGLGVNWLGNGTTFPPTPNNENDAFYHSTHNTSYIYNGTTWDTLVSGNVGSAGFWSQSGNTIYNNNNSNSGNVSIGTTLSLSKLTVGSVDSTVATFVGSNTNVAVIAVANTNANGTSGIAFVNGSNSNAFMAYSPSNKTLSIVNGVTDGHLYLNSDSSIVHQSLVIANQAQKIANQAQTSIYNNTDTIYSYSTNGPIINANSGSFLTDSLYVLGNNFLNANWILANDGTGQAKWTDPNTLGLGNDNQDLSLTGNSLSLTNDPTPVDLTPFMDNTDAQTLTLASNTLTISNGNSVTLPTSPWAKTGTTLHPAIAGDNVGIGTTASSNKLQIHTATNGVKNLHLTSASTGTTNTDGFEISNDASTTLNMWQKENADWNFNTSSSGSIAISIKSNTNVGIGTSTAMNRLTVAGGTSIGGGYIGNGAPANGLLVEGNVGIGTTSPLVKFHVEENASAVMMLKEVTPTNGAAFVMESLNQYVLLSNESGTFRIENATNSLQPFNINPSGQVGIGGDAFHSALDVHGKITMRNGATNGYIPVSDANGTMTWTDPNTVISVTPSPWMLNGTNIHPVSITNNVGIGTNAPNAQLEVTRGVLGDIQLFPVSNTTNPLVINASGTGGKYFQFNHPNGISMNFGSNGTTGWMGTNSNHNLSLVTNSNIAATITNTGNVGIGTTTPSAKLDVDNGGSIEVDGEYTYETPKTHYYSVAGNSFVGTREGLDLWNASLNLIYGQWSSGSATYPIAVAPVNLPDGATITDVTAYIYDNDGTITYQPRITLYTIFMSSGSYGIVGTGTLASNSVSTTPQALSITTNHTVNNQNAYYLKFQSEGNAGSNIRLYGVRITYTVNKAD